MKFRFLDPTLTLKRETGTGLIEVLVSILLIAIMGMSVLKSSIMSLRASKLTELNHAASSIVASRIEELAAIRISDLNDGFDEVDTEVTWGGHTVEFLRTTELTVNADGSVDVDVTVRPDSTAIPTSVDFSTTFVPWE